MRLDHIAQTATVIFQLFRLDADQDQFGRQFAGQFGRHQHLLKAGLMQTHFFDAHEARHLITYHFTQCSWWIGIIDRIKDQQAISLLHIGQQVKALRTAIHQLHLRRKLPVGVERLDTTHTETLISPKNIANTQHQNAFGIHYRHLKKCPGRRFMRTGANAKQSLILEHPPTGNHRRDQRLPAHDVLADRGIDMNQGKGHHDPHAQAVQVMHLHRTTERRNDPAEQ